MKGFDRVSEFQSIKTRLDDYLTGSAILDVRVEHISGAEPIRPHARLISLSADQHHGFELPVPDGSQDAVFAASCLQLLDDPEAAIREWMRAVRRGGHLIVTVPHQFLYERRVALPSRWTRQHKRFYTPAGLLSEVERALQPNCYRVRRLMDDDANFDYARRPDQPATGSHDIELVIERIAEPEWQLDSDSGKPEYSISPSVFSQPRGDVWINEFLRSMPLLERAEHRRTGNKAKNCRMCGGNAVHFTYVDFNKSCRTDIQFKPSGVLVGYMRCTLCDFIFTDFFDEWTSTDFGELIYNADYIKVDEEYLGERPHRSAQAMVRILSAVKNGRILDYGSGNGRFAEELGKLGFGNVENYDVYASPGRPEGRFDVITSFDVIEHSLNPRETIKDMLSFMKNDGCLFIGQTFQPEDIDQIRGDWWYLAPRNGHISTFSADTMRMFAEREKLRFDNFGASFAISRPERSEVTQRIIATAVPVKLGVQLLAPGDLGAEPFGWQPLEWDVEGFSFRWTSEREVSFGELVLEGKCRFEIPYHIAIDDVFLERSALRIGAETHRLRCRGKLLIAEFFFARRMLLPVTLVTPPPIAPAERDVPEDKRRLGIAVISAFDKSGCTRTSP
jgi:SAM-dependent methyltransferase